MKNLNRGIKQISERLRVYLREKLNNSMIDYDSPLTQLKGGNETSIYHFKLKGVQQELSKPLILRVYPQFYDPEIVIWESILHNVLARVGYSVPQAYFPCPDISILGGVFFIMDFLPGKPMGTANIEKPFEMLGNTHAAMHSIDPELVVKGLSKQGIDKNKFRLKILFDYLKDRANDYPWFREVVDWLLKHRPLEPEHLSVCHGDFQPLNILIQDGKVTGVIDWPNFRIAEPAYDIANTLSTITLLAKQPEVVKLFAPTLEHLDWEMGAELYLNAYRSRILLDSTNLDYYRAMQSVKKLMASFGGHQVLQHPLVFKPMIESIHEITEIRIRNFQLHLRRFKRLGFL